MNLNRKNKNGSWTLVAAYGRYRQDGGMLDPASWNEATKELMKQNRSRTNA